MDAVWSRDTAALFMLTFTTCDEEPPCFKQLMRSGESVLTVVYGWSVHFRPTEKGVGLKCMVGPELLPCTAASVYV